MPADAGGVEQDAEDLGIRRTRPPGAGVERPEREQPGGEAAEQVEDRGAQDERGEEQAALGSPDRERLVDRVVHRVDVRRVSHGTVPVRLTGTATP